MSDTRSSYALVATSLEEAATAEELALTIDETPSEVTPSHFAGLPGAMWDGVAMLVGTLVWMSVYYAKDWFAEMDDDGALSYALHCFAMGIAANLAVLPLVKKNHLSRGETSGQANAEIKKYFFLCVIPDVLYEPTADWLTAMEKADSFTDFEFEKYAQPTFSVREIGGAFTFFGVAYGLIYYMGDKLIQYCSPDEKPPKEIIPPNAPLGRKVLKKICAAIESSEGVAVLAALQYFIFYMTDDVFDVDWESFLKTTPQVVGMAGLMSFYTFLVDSMPMLLNALADKLYPQERTDVNDDNLDDFIRGIYRNNLSQPLIDAQDGENKTRRPLPRFFRHNTNAQLNPLAVSTVNLKCH